MQSVHRSEPPQTQTNSLRHEDAEEERSVDVAADVAALECNASANCQTSTTRDLSHLSAERVPPLRKQAAIDPVIGTRSLAASALRNKYFFD
jgi:hypothetical protein